MHKLLRVAAAFTAFGFLSPAWADVTIQEQTTINASIVKLHATSTKKFTADKQRSEMQMSCDGLMSWFCGHSKTLEIVRLDRDLTWNLQPKQARYTEIPFPSPEQQRAKLAHQQAVLAKLKSCPQAQPAAQGVDTSKCEMSPPVLTVNKTEDAANLIGHSAKRTNVVLTQSCKVKDTGDVCLMTSTLDVWLTQDELAGLSDRKTFQHGYQQRLGLGDASSNNPTDLNSVLAPYADSLKQLSAKSADFAGYPLKTVFRLAVSGDHCALSASGTGAGAGAGILSSAGHSAGQATQSSAEHAAGWGAADAVQRAGGGGIGGYVAGSTAGAFTQSLVGNLFARKKAPEPAVNGASPTVGADASQTVLAEVSVETTAIDTSAVSGDQFEVPHGWTKIEPKSQSDESLPNCPG